jgi:predicted O-linked N-acetylglucosamine transferase (SPINDLY family)
MFLMEPVLAEHDRSAVELFLYSTSRTADDVTRRIESYATGWRNVSEMTDIQAAEQIENDGIDILVDLSGHTAGNRLGIFALKPAPVQATYCGYPNSTGLTQIDYRISDCYSDPPGATEALHSEVIWRLAPGFLCYRPPEYAGPVSTLPALQSGHISFGCFAGRQKITEAQVAAWAEILLRASGSRLILKCSAFSDPAIAAEVRSRLEQLGVAPGRVEILGHSKRADHIWTHKSVDLVLDTFPYNGTITTCEALWMGAPVVTLAGRTHVSRVGVSLLGRLGLEDWIAHSWPEYVDIAVASTSDLAGLAELRASLRERFRHSSIGDPRPVTRALEEAYRGMWGRWLAQQRSTASEGTPPAAAPTP